MFHQSVITIISILSGLDVWFLRTVYPPYSRQNRKDEAPITKLNIVVYSSSVVFLSKSPIPTQSGRNVHFLVVK